MALEKQREILREMTEVMSTPIVPGKKSLLFFQTGILVNNKALDMLLEYVAKFEMKYIVTSRLNQDILEHFFGAIRSKGGLNDHPTPKEFKYRLRKYVMGKYI